MAGLFLFCRPGFESECAAELLEQASRFGVTGHCKAKAGAGYVRFESYPPEAAADLTAHLNLAQLTFARQWFVEIALPNDLPVTDRVTPLLECAHGLPRTASQLLLEYTDTEQGKPLARLARALATPLRIALEGHGLLQGDGDTGPTLHICLLSTHAACVGFSERGNDSPWPGGIPRLKFPPGAPSRSTLKLEEALLLFLDEEQRARLLRPGMRAVDLGAAPGGWTWQLVRRGMRVVAVDNGALAESLLATGLVDHERRDGFRFEPSAAVDWMVCDMVEQPIRVAELAARWLAHGWCRRTIFNLKLPMKKRYQELQRCLLRIDERLRAAGVDYGLRCKQLYHDREEVTAMLWRADESHHARR